MNMEYLIGEVAKKFHLTISQIRYYDKEGLLPEIKRVSVIRKFSEQDIETIFLIECLKKSGLQLKEIKQFIEWTKQGDSTIETRFLFFKNQENKILKQMEELNKTLKMVQYKCWYYQKAKELGSIAKLEQEKSKVTPKEIQILFDKAHY